MQSSNLRRLFCIYLFCFVRVLSADLHRSSLVDAICLIHGLLKRFAMLFVWRLVVNKWEQTFVNLKNMHGCLLLFSFFHSQAKAKSHKKAEAKAHH